MKKPLTLPSTQFLIALLTLMAAFGPLSIDLYLPAFPQIETGLNTTKAEIQRTLTAFLLGLCVGMMFYGSLSDKYGRKILILVGSIIYTVTSLIAAFAPTVEYLFYMRFFQAIGAGACMVVGRAIIRDVFTGKRVAMMMSVVQVILMIAPLLAPLLGVLLLYFFQSWRALFILLSFFGLLVFLATLLYLPETYRKEDRQPISLADTFLNYFRILRDPRSLGSILACALPSGFVFAYITGSPHLYQQHYGVSEFTFALLFGLNIIGVIISALLNIQLLRRYSINGLILFGLSWMALAGLFTILFGGKSLLLMATSSFLLMCVSGFVGNNLASRIIELNYHKAGAAMALNSASQFAIGALASLLVTKFGQMHWVMGGCGILAIIAYLLLGKPFQQIGGEEL